VLHKTSKFDQNELDGFQKAIDERDIDYADFVWVQKSLTRLYRLGVYPPLRGTPLRFDKDQALLYTRGRIEFFRTYRRPVRAPRAPAAVPSAGTAAPTRRRGDAGRGWMPAGIKARMALVEETICAMARSRLTSGWK
jgi:hypothetical protein